MASLLVQALAPALRTLGIRYQKGQDDPAPTTQRRPCELVQKDTLFHSEVEYPAPLLVRNTFVDVDIGRPLSLDGFYAEREVHSSPGSAIDPLWSGAEVPQLLSLTKLRLGRVQEADGSSSCRSTSVGSAEDSPEVSISSPRRRSEVQDLAGLELQSCRSALCRAEVPEFEYPEAIAVKNTFIHANIGRAPSLDGYYEERRLRSCPVSVIDEPSIMAGAPCASECSNTRNVARDALQASCWPAGIPPPPAEPPALLPPTMLQTGPPGQAPAAPPLLPQDSSMVLELSRLLEAATPRSLDLPSAGSVHHCQGTCSPCAHFHSRNGCKNGVSCQFCHLCPPGELKRQQKAKRLAKQRSAGSPAPA